MSGLTGARHTTNGLFRMVPRLFVFLLAAGLMPEGLQAQDAKRGEDIYKLCASCHGFKGEGNPLVNAPGLAGQEDWYLERQINNFRHGIRGAKKDDGHGQTMALMTVGLESDAKVRDLVAYIGTLPTYKSPSTISGDLANGKNQYLPCAACHGANAQGDRAFDAPALVGMDDWYQIAQLKKFKNGQRGADATDVYGQQMAPMALVLFDDQAMLDVVAYINSLQ